MEHGQNSTAAGRTANAVELAFWNRWNLDRIDEGLVRERRDLCEAVVNEVLYALPYMPRDARLLDVGMGAGWTTERLYREFDYTGLDLSPASIAAVQERLPDAKLAAVDFLDWQAPAEHFDVVLCVDTIAYIDAQASAVQKIWDTLKVGGHVVITAVNPFIYSRLKWVGPPGEGQVRKWLTRAELEQLLVDNGFVVERSRTILPSGDQGWLRVLNARRVKAVLGYRFERLKEWLGLGQFSVVVARKVGP